MISAFSAYWLDSGYIHGVISHIFYVKVNSYPEVTFVVVSVCQQRQVCTVQTVQKVGDSTVPFAFRQWWWSRRAENCGVPQLQFSDKLVTCLLL